MGYLAYFTLAVTLGTLFGPAQVGARFVERLFGTHYHPVWTMVASCALMLVGLVLLFGGFPILALTILIYGSGYGIMQGAAEANEIRTPALWGLRFRRPLMHDGTATLEGAIRRHAREGELARQGFDRLGDADRAALLAFLGSL